MEYETYDYSNVPTAEETTTGRTAKIAQVVDRIVRTSVKALVIKEKNTGKIRKPTGSIITAYGVIQQHTPGTSAWENVTNTLIKDSEIAVVHQKARANPV
jgi:hypothetical protein